MTVSDARFYVIGGTLHSDAPSYIPRAADSALLDSLRAGEFCYVFNARQMGKSSLMVRTAARLKAEGIAVIVLDLTAIGQNLTVEQWYDGLLVSVGKQLDLEDELDDFWLDNERVGPLQRWIQALREVVLEKIAWRVVIFIDEIDAVRSLPFSTDEFFAGIREIYNRRTQDPILERLTFCLLGVATPADLIQDTRTTPFNIGRRIELTDFTAAEALVLAKGLHQGKSRETLLERALFWTGGHPHLTQRLCQAIAQTESITSPADVDRICAELFLTHKARETEDNLMLVHNRLLKSEVDTVALLELYRQIAAGKPVPDDEANPLVSALKLSGVVKSRNGMLVVRNRIYARVFDKAWIAENMPDAELRRQRRAYRLGVLRTSLVSGALLLVISSLAFVAWRNAQRADRNARAARDNARRAEAVAIEATEQRKIAEKRFYYAAMNLAQQALATGSMLRVQSLLESHRPAAGQEDIRGFEWRYLWRLAHQEDYAFADPKSQAFTLAPDGRTLALIEADGSIRFWDTQTRKDVGTLHGSVKAVGDITFTGDGKILATGGEDGTIRRWDVPGRHELPPLPGPVKSLSGLVFAPNGKWLASYDDRALTIWDAHTGRKFGEIAATDISDIHWSPDSERLVCCHQNVTLWDMLKNKRQTIHEQVNPSVATFSRDSHTLFIMNTRLEKWNIRSMQKPVISDTYNNGWTRAVALSKDGTILALGMDNDTILLKSLQNMKTVAMLKGHVGNISYVAFGSTDNDLLSFGDDGFKMWRLPIAPSRQSVISNLEFTARSPLNNRIAPPITGRDPHDLNVFFDLSPDKTKLAACGGQEIHIWETASKRPILTLNLHQPIFFNSLRFSPDGAQLAVCVMKQAARQNCVRVWDTSTWREESPITPSSEPLYSLAFSSDGLTLAIGSINGKIYLWNRKTNHTDAVLSGGSQGTEEDRIFQLAFSADGRRLVSGSQRSIIHVWDFPSLKTVAMLDSGNTVSVLSVSPDGRFVATNAGLWDIQNPQFPYNFLGHAYFVQSIAFAPDGRTVATGSKDGTVKLWGVNPPQELITLKAHQGGVNALLFTPDGNTLITAGEDKTIRFWEAAPLALTDGTVPR